MFETRVEYPGGVIAVLVQLESQANLKLINVIRPPTTGFRRLNTEDSSEQSFGELVGHLMAKLGAVPVTPRNMFKLLKAGESVLLYPGGAKEALHRKV